MWIGNKLIADYDFGKEYLTMCKKANKYLKLSFEPFDNTFISQDESQTMLNGTIRQKLDWQWDFICSNWHGIPGTWWCDEVLEERGYTSMERLWLMVLMERNYGRNWNGKSWVKRKGESSFTDRCVEK